MTRKIILQGNGNISLVSGSWEPRFFSVDTEDETGMAEADSLGQRTNPVERPDMGCQLCCLKERGTAETPQSSTMDNEQEKCIELFYCLHVDVWSDQWPYLS